MHLHSATYSPHRAGPSNSSMRRIESRQPSSVNRPDDAPLQCSREESYQPVQYRRMSPEYQSADEDVDYHIGYDHDGRQYDYEENEDEAEDDQWQ